MVANYFPYTGQAENLKGVPEDWALQQGGIEEFFFQKDIVIGAADGNGSTYCIMNKIPASAIIDEMKIEVAANAAFTSLSIGIYDSDTGAAIAAGCYLLNKNVAAGATKNAPFDGMEALTFEQTVQRVFELAGATLQTKKGRYDIVATANAATNAQIKMSVRGRIVKSV